MCLYVVKAFQFCIRYATLSTPPYRCITRRNMKSRLSVAAVAAVVAAMAATARVDARLNACQVERLALAAGMNESMVARMVCVARFESAWNPTASMGHFDSGRYGLWKV